MNLSNNNLIIKEIASLERMVAGLLNNSVKYLSQGHKMWDRF